MLQQLRQPIQQANEREEKVKSLLILEALILPCYSTEEEAMSMKHAT
jgi:hypothetical protein